jgi:two-component system phosphate regulon sensor histidine kinase PhoR
LYILVIILAALSALLLYAFLDLRRRLSVYNKARKRYAKLLDIPENSELIYIYHQLRKKLAAKNREIDLVKRKLEYFSLVLNNLGEALFIVNDEGKVNYFNKSAREITKIPEPMSRKISEVIDNYNITDLLDDVIKNDETQKAEIVIFLPKRRYYECQIIPVIYGDENNYMILLRDITREQEIDEMRREFISNVSHELKTPLTSIHGYAETLMDMEFGDESGVVKQFVSIIEKESGRMTRLINDLLDLEKLDSGNTGFEMENVNLDEVLEYVNEIIEPLAEESGVELIYDTGDNIALLGDFDRLVQLLLNLTDNAIKYTTVKEHGEKKVWIRTWIEEENAVIQVEDTGIGIPKEAKERVFSRFFRVDKARSRSMGGTGLGLAIVRFIAEKHNGKVIMESEFGKGTTFTVKLPIKKVSS